jgi:hypothetical protein
VFGDSWCLRLNGEEVEGAGWEVKVETGRGVRSRSMVPPDSDSSDEKGSSSSEKDPRVCTFAAEVEAFPLCLRLVREE